MKSNQMKLLLVALASALACAGASAQQVVYPAKGQSPDQPWRAAATR